MMRPRKPRISRLIAALALFMAQPVATVSLAAGATYHLALDGDDAADGKTRSNAWRDPGRALGRLQAGDTLLWHPGRWLWGGRASLQGQPGAPITIRAAGPGVILDGRFAESPAKWQPTRVPGVHVAHFAAAPEAVFDRGGEGLTAAPMRHGLAPGDCRGVPHCWAWDRNRRRLHVHLSDGATPAVGQVVVSRHRHGLFLQPRKGGRSAHVHIVGLRLQHYSDAAIGMSAAARVTVAGVTIRGAGIGVLAYDSPDVSVTDAVIVGAAAPRRDVAAAILFLGKSPRGRAERNLVVAARDAGIRGQGDTRGAVAIDNLVARSPLPLFFKASGFPSVASGNVLLGGKVLRWSGGGVGRNLLVGCEGKADKRDDRCGRFSRCARRGVTKLVQRWSKHVRNDTAQARAELAKKAGESAFSPYLVHASRASSGVSTRGSKRAVATASTRRLHVSPTGDDNADGLSPATAWRSLDRAAHAARPGDTVVLLPGVHVGLLAPARSGTAKRPITYTGLARSPAVLDGRHVAEALVRLRDVQHIHLAHLVLRDWHNVPQGAVLLDNATHIRIRRCFFDGRGALGAGVHTRWRTTNSLQLTDSAFLATWWAIRWQRGSLVAQHNVFDVGMFGAVQLLAREGCSVALRHNAVTSAAPNKRLIGGFLVDAPDAAMVTSEHNAWFFQRDDHHHNIARVAGHALRGEDGLRQWRLSGNDRRSQIVENPGFTGWQANEPRNLRPGRPLALNAWKLQSKSPLHDAGDDGAPIGVRWR